MSKEQPWATMLITTPSQADYAAGKEEAVPIIKDYQSAIYFMKISDLPESPDIISKRNKYPKVSMLQNVKRAFIRVPHNAYGLNGLQFANRYELYKYMEQFEGVNVPLWNTGHMHYHLDDNTFKQYLKERNMKWLDGNDPQVRDSVMRFLDMRLQKARENRENREKRNREQGQLKAPRANNILTVNIQNQRVNYDHSRHKYYFHFDVYANANSSSTYLDNVVMRLNYNTAAFGTNIKANSKVTVERSDEFNTPTYDISNSSVYDATYNSLNIGIGASADNPVRVQLTTNPVKLMAVKIELLNGLTGTPSGIIFTDVAYTDDFSWFAPASTSSWEDTEQYDATNYNNPPSFTIYSVAPTLSSFSPATTRAGVDETVTLYGNNFGTQKGELLFTKDGIAQGTADFLKGLDAMYINSWTNTQITVKVPSHVRKGYIDEDENPTPGHGSGAGSGKIKVKTARNDTVISAASLNIEYSIANASNSPMPDLLPVCRVYLARLTEECIYDITFTLHSSFEGAAKAEARSAVEAALQKWTDLSDIKVGLERNSANTDYVYENSFVDTKNVIGFAQYVNGNYFSGMAAVTNRIVQGVPAGDMYDCPKFCRSTGSHIYIQQNPNFPWVYQTSGTVNQHTVSFYNAILHEIAHVLNVNHVNNTNDLMYYTINVDNNYTVTDLTSASQPAVAVASTVAASQYINWQHSQLYPLGPCDPVGIYDKVTIRNPPPGTYVSGVQYPLPDNTYIMEPCSTANFFAEFESGSDPATYSTAFDWQIVLYRADGSEYVYKQQNGVAPNCFTPTTIYVSCFWQFASDALPAGEWQYDSSGNISGKVMVTVHISDGGTKTDRADISVVPYKNINDVIYTSNTTIDACSDIYLNNVQIQGTSSVTFNMNGHDITINEPFEVSSTASFTVNP
jgi:hypothetical protein